MTLEDGMKILLWSKDNPKLKSGYGIGGAHLGPGLEDMGHEVTYYCPVGHSGYVDYFEDIPVLPGTNDEPFDEESLKVHWDKLDPDIAVSWCDLTAMSEAPKWFAQDGTRHWISYAPIDYVGLPDHFLNKIRCADLFVPFCWDAYDRLEEYDVENLAEPIYHGINTALWKPLDTSNYPNAMKSLGFTEEGFNILIDAANQYSRKAWSESIEAISAFRKNTDVDVNLYIHSNPYVKGGWHLPKLVEHFNLKDCTRIADNYEKAYGIYSEEEMALIYNCADVALVPGMEGFGWSHIQAQAVRTPVVGLNAGPGPELVKAGVLVPPKDYSMNPSLMQRPIPNQKGIAMALETVLESSSNWEKGEKFVREEGGFDWWRDILPAWKELLESYKEDVDTKCKWGPPEPSRELKQRSQELVVVE